MLLSPEGLFTGLFHRRFGQNQAALEPPPVLLLLDFDAVLMTMTEAECGTSMVFFICVFVL